MQHHLCFHLPVSLSNKPKSGQFISCTSWRRLRLHRKLFALASQLPLNCSASSTDVNECADDTLNACHQHAACTNTDGSYNCTCNQGYSGNGYICNRKNVCLYRVSFLPAWTSSIKWMAAISTWAFEIVGRWCCIFCCCFWRPSQWRLLKNVRKFWELTDLLAHWQHGRDYCN